MIIIEKQIKRNILESWIVVEHLSEGNINLKDRQLRLWNNFDHVNYCSFLKDKIEQSKYNHYDKSGLVLYFNIFSFSEIVELLKKKYKITMLDEEIQVGDKFSFALYFDKKLTLNGEMTFTSMSYYIRKFKIIPNEEQFKNFENEVKLSIRELFMPNENKGFEENFNIAFEKLIENYSIDLNKCRIKLVANIETDETNLHSFYTKDLEEAKYIDSDNLYNYLFKKDSKRIDLDSRNSSSKYNPGIINDILQPSNFPISRFPSNPKHALSLMQQIAVNLAIGFDNEKMRSVNGPPGTGKTTLLKDIFSELIVKQSVNICDLSNKAIRGTKKTTYYKQASIGKLPEKIAENGIVVVSSNNGAVQNIVNELPLSKEISEEFRTDIYEADYFKDIANSKLSTKWENDENGKPKNTLVSKPNEDTNKLWGMFSLEGGKKDNMENVLTVIKHILRYLEEDYIPNEKIYDNFLEQFKRVKEFKEERQKIADNYIKMQNLLIDTEIKEKHFLKDKSKKEKDMLKNKNSVLKNIRKLKEKLKIKDNKLGNIIENIKQLENEKNSANESLKILRLQKPNWFNWGKARQKYNEKRNSYSEKILNLIDCLNDLNIEKNRIENDKRELKYSINKLQLELDEEEKIFKNWIQKRQNEFNILSDKIRYFEKDLKHINPLNMNQDYNQIQKSSPWFDEKFRVMQSKLFIEALKVRKQFLYENRKNLKAASIIWNTQSEHLDNKIIIAESWNWLNMAIPVISTTFASVSRMCANLQKETIGHLFIDEAGQALPQASVGAIIKSKNVMAVGDPAQIKPVLTLDTSVLRTIGQMFGVSEKYISDTASTQTLLDEASKFGFYKDEAKEDWVGIPLWVHRRCLDPMFSISNKISYGGNMVQSNESPGKAKWFDIRGNAIDKYVREQGEFLKEIILEMNNKTSNISEVGVKDRIFVITPFKNVANQLSRELDEIGFTRYDKNKKATNIGTVHTFQGKEAPIVFLVLGADTKSTGAAQWAMGTNNPNIMNVAATRAKEEFYIIGDKQLYMNLNSEVINNTNEIICEFNSKVQKSSSINS